jgi:hypothetical protein
MKPSNVSNTTFLMLIIVISNAMIGELSQTELESWISKKTGLYPTELKFVDFKDSKWYSFKAIYTFGARLTRYVMHTQLKRELGDNPHIKIAAAAVTAEKLARVIEKKIIPIYRPWVSTEKFVSDNKNIVKNIIKNIGNFYNVKFDKINNCGKVIDKYTLNIGFVVVDKTIDFLQWLYDNLKD